LYALFDGLPRYKDYFIVHALIARKSQAGLSGFNPRRGQAFLFSVVTYRADVGHVETGDFFF
jgi:hypothetical protein